MLSAFEVQPVWRAQARELSRGARAGSGHREGGRDAWPGSVPRTWQETPVGQAPKAHANTGGLTGARGEASTRRAILKTAKKASEFHWFHTKADSQGVACVDS